jgi:hypothetical protein
MSPARRLVDRITGVRAGCDGVAHIESLGVFDLPQAPVSRLDASSLTQTGIQFFKTP